MSFKAGRIAPFTEKPPPCRTPRTLVTDATFSERLFTSSRFPGKSQRVLRLFKARDGYPARICRLSRCVEDLSVQKGMNSVTGHAYLPPHHRTYPFFRSAACLISIQFIFRCARQCYLVERSEGRALHGSRPNSRAYS